MEVGERQIAPNCKGIRADHRGRYEFTLRFIPDRARILDMACGVGYGAYILANQSPCEGVVAVDINSAAIDYGKKFYSSPKIDYRIDNCLTVPLEPESFDVICCFETIEHIEEDKLLLEKFYNAIKPYGKLICSTPNQEKMEFSHERFPFHVRHYTPSEFKKLLYDAGFEIEQTWSQSNTESSKIVQGWEGAFNIAICIRRI